jgi:hypothetical protein
LALVAGEEDIDGRPDIAQSLERGLSWLLRGRAPCGSLESQVIPDTNGGTDPDLIGWPWSEGDCFWVFPTALAVLAAVEAGSGDAAAVRNGVAFLVDRACRDGGWSMGDPSMLDKLLLPGVFETAMAITALEAASWEGTELQQGIGKLRELIDQTRGATSVAWGLLGLQAGGERVESGAARLADQQRPDGSWRGSPYVTALAVLALSGQSLSQPTGKKIGK